MKSQPSRNHSGFTLVELLVVITIIIVLAALTVVGVSRMRAAADSAATVAAMRQLQTANVSFAADHNDRYVSYSNTDPNGGITYWWRNFEFLAYLSGNQSLAGSTLDTVNEDTVAPLSLMDPTTVRAKQRWSTRLAASYGMNHEFIKTVTYPDNSKEKYIQTSKLTNPSRTVVFITATDSAMKYTGRKAWWSSPVEGKTQDGKMAFRHNNKAIAVYFDGGCGIVTKLDIDRFDANGGSSSPFWNGVF